MIIASFSKDISKDIKGYINNKIKQRSEIDLYNLCYSIVYKKIDSNKHEHNTENFLTVIHFFIA